MSNFFLAFLQINTHFFYSTLPNYYLKVSSYLCIVSPFTIHGQHALTKLKSSNVQIYTLLLLNIALFLPQCFSIFVYCLFFYHTRTTRPSKLLVELKIKFNSVFFFPIHIQHSSYMRA